MMDDSKSQTGISLMNKLREQTTTGPATEEQEEFFLERTSKHISMVQDAIAKIVAAYPDEFSGLIEQGEDHDASKFSEPERTPYIALTWNKRKVEKDNISTYKGPGNHDKESINQATHHHITTNRHHPEYWTKDEVKLNNTDRAKLDEPVDVSEMPDTDIAEMVADWQAMGQEMGNPARAWFEKVRNTRWKFSPEQEKLIDRLLKVFEVKDTIKEETTSGDIAYAPGALKPATPEVLASVEDHSEEDNKEIARKTIARHKQIKEAMDAKMPQLKAEIRKVLLNICNTNKFNWREFYQTFKGNDMTPKSIMINLSHAEKDIDAILASLDSMGEMEMLLTALEDKDTMENTVIAKYLYICGIRIQASPAGRYGKKLIYAGYVDTLYTVKENIYVGDIDYQEAIQQEWPQLKIVNNVIFAPQGLFAPGFFAKLYTVMEQRDHKKE